MKGIVLAGGAGTRLHPVTRVVCKQLLPVYDAPMIHYPLSVLLRAGIRDILVITTPDDRAAFESLLGTGSQWGVHITYAAQPTPGGLAEAFLIGAEFIGTEPCALILGDNIFHGPELTAVLTRAATLTEGALAFGVEVHDPERYGVIEFDDRGRVVRIVEKPAKPRSPYALTGLFFFDPDVVRIARELRPSPRGELEITDVLLTYLAAGSLSVQRLGHDFAWFDTGTHESLLDAAWFVREVERSSGTKVACLEEIALDRGFIDRDAVRDLASALGGSATADYLRRVADRG